MNHTVADVSELVVVGDVHGHLALLENLYAQVQKKWPGVRVCLAGDLVDRGPDSKGVVQFAIDHSLDCVLGNHDEMFLSYLQSSKLPADVEQWVDRRNGGKATMDSYTEGDKLHVPDSHVQWLKSLSKILSYSDMCVEGKPVIVTHAPFFSIEGYGINTWNSRIVPSLYEDFVGVCGHLIFSKVERRGNLFLVDTGACLPDGRLSALKLPEGDTLSVGY